jgi:DNA-binding PadR family transcriptional regulator
MGALTRIVDDLEEEGLVRRERTERDRRVVEIALTPQGRRYFQTGKRLVVELLNSLMEPFSRQELETLIVLLQRLMARLQEAQATISPTQPQQRLPHSRARSTADASGSGRLRRSRKGGAA